MNEFPSTDDLPNLDPTLLVPIDIDTLVGPEPERHAPRILILYGSLHERSYSRFLAEEAARLLRWFGCDVCLSIQLASPCQTALKSTTPK